jgi:hypothetical protein
MTSSSFVNRSPAGASRFRGTGRRPSPDDAPSEAAGDRRGGGAAQRNRHRAAAFALLALATAGCATGAGLGHATLDAAVASATGELARELSEGAGEAAGRRVAVMPPRAATAPLAELSADLRHRLGDHLRALAPGLVLVERDDLDALWSEHRLPVTGLLDPAAVAELGRILGADALLLGSLGEIEDVPQLHVRLVDVETAEILASASRPLGLRGGATARRPRERRAEGGRAGGHPLAARPASAGDEDGDGAAEAIAEAPTVAPLARPSAPSSPDRPVVGDFRVGLEGCGFVDRQLVCRLTVTNLAPGARTLTILAESALHDTRGDDYRLQRVRIGTAVTDLEHRAAAARHAFPAGLRATVELTFSGVPRSKKKAQLLDVRFAEGRWTATDVPLERD